MSIRVLFFSLLRDLTGAEEVVMPLPAASLTVADLLTQLYALYPALRGWDGSLLVAVNQVYARGDVIIPDQAEVAIMPPVQGG